MSWTNDLGILLYYTLHRAPSLRDISLQSSYESNISRGIYEDLQIEKTSYPLIIEHHKTIEYDYPLRLKKNHLLFPRMSDEIILRHHRTSSVFQIIEIGKHQIHVKGIWMVEINRRDVIVIYLGCALIIIILFNQEAFIGYGLNPLYYSAFAASRASCYTNEFYHGLNPFELITGIGSPCKPRLKITALIIRMIHEIRVVLTLKAESHERAYRKAVIRLIVAGEELPCIKLNGRHRSPHCKPPISSLHPHTAVQREAETMVISTITSLSYAMCDSEIKISALDLILRPRNQLIIHAEILIGIDTDYMAPYIPTAKECGLDMEFAHWMGILAPKGMPDEAKATLEKVMKEVVESEDFKKEAIRIKTAAHWMSGKEFRERYYEELAQYKKILEENGLIAK